LGHHWRAVLFLAGVQANCRPAMALHAGRGSIGAGEKIDSVWSSQKGETMIHMIIINALKGSPGSTRIAASPVSVAALQD
jgi:hypothetical protein